MTDLASLIAKLEVATEGSRELDFNIANYLGGIEGWTTAKEAAESDWVTEHRDQEPRYTTSLDAALSLVPEGWDGELEISHASPHCYRVRRGTYYTGPIKKSPALCLCIAALKARTL